MEVRMDIAKTETRHDASYHINEDRLGYYARYGATLKRFVDNIVLLTFSESPAPWTIHYLGSWDSECHLRR